MSPTVLVTGASRGLGLATADALAAGGAEVLRAGRSPAAPVHLDLSSLAAVREAAAALPHVDAVACIAGLQHPGASSLTRDGFEETFQVNHLAHLVLLDALLARPEPPSLVVFVGSATHDPAVRTGTPDPYEGDLPAIAREPRDGMRSYTTSKLLAVATAAALARERPALRSYAFDPGLMPGTGLARERSVPVRALWATVFRAAAVLPFASTPHASGRALARLLTEAEPSAPSGAYLDFRLRRLTPSDRARDPAFQAAVLRDTRALASGSG